MKKTKINYRTLTFFFQGPTSQIPAKLVSENFGMAELQASLLAPFLPFTI